MGVLAGFERRLEGAVEGMFARLFKSGLQPIELAQAIQRYVTDHRTVTSSGVDVPNDYRLAIHPEDAERLSGYGESLPRELSNVVRATARERGWNLPGPVVIRTITDDEVDVGRYLLTGRVHTPSTDQDASAAPARRDDRPAGPSRPLGTAGQSSGSTSAPVAPPPPAPEYTRTSGRESVQEPTQHLPPNGVGGARPAAARTPVADLRLEVADTGQALDLVGGRYVIGRLGSCDLPVDSTTVSREHAALVKRNDTWWVVDLGSTNGTRVNDVRASEQPIRPGDRIQVGTVDLTAHRPGREG